jgi:hypothetical protein
MSRLKQVLLAGRKTGESQPVQYVRPVYCPMPTRDFSLYSVTNNIVRINLQLTQLKPPDWFEPESYGFDITKPETRQYPGPRQVQYKKKMAEYKRERNRLQKEMTRLVLFLM